MQYRTAIVAVLAVIMLTGCNGGEQVNWLADVRAHYQEADEKYAELPGFTVVPIAEWRIDDGKSDSVSTVLRNDGYESTLVIFQVSNFRNTSLTSSRTILPETYTAVEVAADDPSCETILEPQSVEIGQDTWHVMMRLCDNKNSPASYTYFRGPLSGTNAVQYHAVLVTRNAVEEKIRNAQKKVASETVVMLMTLTEQD